MMSLSWVHKDTLARKNISLFHTSTTKLFHFLLTQEKWESH